eukprot:3329133-Amphidinium_carterae.3
MSRWTHSFGLQLCETTTGIRSIHSGASNQRVGNHLRPLVAVGGVQVIGKLDPGSHEMKSILLTGKHALVKQDALFAVSSKDALHKHCKHLLNLRLLRLCNFQWVDPTHKFGDAQQTASAPPRQEVHHLKTIKYRGTMASSSKTTHSSFELFTILAHNIRTKTRYILRAPSPYL